jgi:hypothetical protein
LKLYSSVVVVPVFYGTYTALGLVNTIIYLDEIGNYPPWAIILVFVGIGVLIYGVFLLSSKPDPAAHLNEQDNNDQELVPVNWLTAKEEKEVVAARHNDALTTKISLGESSTSHQRITEAGAIIHQNQYGPLSKLFKRLKYLNHPHQPPRREMDTFISLHSASTSDHVIPLAIHSDDYPKPPPNSYLP